MKTCPHCGKELPNEMQFCPYCMHKLIVEQAVGGVQKKKRQYTWLWIVGGAAAFVLVCGLLVCGLIHLANRNLPTGKPVDAPPVSFVGDADDENADATTTTTNKNASTTTASAAGEQATEDASVTTTTTRGSTTRPSTVTTTTRGSTTRKSITTSKTTTTTTKASKTTERSSTTRPTTDTTNAAPTTSYVHGHAWEDITELIYYEEVGHYEDVAVDYYTITMYRCAVCYSEFDSFDDYNAHFDQHVIVSGDGVEILRDSYHTWTERELIYEEQWVVDEEAYTQERVIGRKCRVCGEEEYD